MPMGSGDVVPPLAAGEMYPFPSEDLRCVDIESGLVLFAVVMITSVIGGSSDCRVAMRCN